LRTPPRHHRTQQLSTSRLGSCDWWELLTTASPHDDQRALSLTVVDTDSFQMQSLVRQWQRSFNVTNQRTSQLSEPTIKPIFNSLLNQPRNKQANKQTNNRRTANNSMATQISWPDCVSAQTEIACIALVKVYPACGARC
jgi:hypothetical protein